MRRSVMLRRLATVAGVATIAALAVAAPAGADAIVEDYTLTCSHFAASGTVTAPYYVVEVYDDDTEVDLLFEAYPSDDGTFDFDLTFDEVPEGTTLEAFVWGSPTDDPNDWDEGDYFEVEVECVPAPEPPTPPTPPAPPVDPGEDTAPADVVAAAPRFTG